MNLLPRCFRLPDPASSLQLLSGDEAVTALSAPSGDKVLRLEVVASCPSPWDGVLAPERCYPRIPGGVFAARDPAGRLLLCGGYLPCAACSPCRAGLHLACLSPTRPGWNSSGGFATSVTVPPLFLAPAAFDVDPAAAVALLAAAGQTYQAQASAGMAPGDAVVVFGPMGPGAFPLQVLAAAGLRVTWVSPAQESPIELPDRVEHRRTWSLDDDLPSARCHLLDLEPTPASIEQWLPLARLCVSCTLVGRLPSTAHAPLHRLLDGEVALRWVHDLHPHLVLDVLSLIVTGRVSVQPHLQPMSFDDFAAADFRRAETGRWPVLVP